MGPAAIVPHLVVHDGTAAVEFYRTALGAEVAAVMPAADGKRVLHAALAVGGAQIFLCDDFPEWNGGKARAPKAAGGAGVTLHLDVPDCDAAIARMAAAGGTVAMPATDAFWGDRYGKVLDPFGHEWSFAHRLPADRAAAAAKAWQEMCPDPAAKA